MVGEREGEEGRRKKRIGKTCGGVDIEKWSLSLQIAVLAEVNVIHIAAV
jgi:hypothetical protein